MMVTRDEAREIAEKFLDENVRYRIEFEIVIIERSIRDDGAGWLFPYDGRAYAESGDWSQMLAGNFPVYVERATGAVGFAETRDKGHR